MPDVTPMIERIRLLRAGLVARGLLPTLLVVLAACGGTAPTPPPSDDEPDDDVPVVVPARGTAATLDAATWNVEWFGDPGNGPEDDLRQLRRVRDVILGAEIDLWALQEVVDAADFAALLAELPGYAGVLATDPAITGGAASYSDFGGNEQKVAFVWRTDVIEFVSGRVILQESDYAFAGRPPVEIRVRATVDGVTRPVLFVTLHAKASTDAESWTRRRDAAVALKGFLDTTWPDDEVIVLGDFNDDVDVSIRQGSPSPYENFVDDALRWSFPTAELSASGATSTVGFSDMIDHILVSDEVAARYQAGSAEVFRLDAFIDAYGSTTSDHYPVFARFGTEVP